MQQNLPNSIRSENDLDYFRNYLNNNSDCETVNNNHVRDMNTVPDNGMAQDNANQIPDNGMTQGNGGYVMEIENGNSRNMSLIPSENSEVPQTLSNTAFLPAYLYRHIGKLMRVEFLLGDRLESKTGVLTAVGAGFIVLKPYQFGTTIVCDIDSLRFATIIHDNDFRRLP